MMKEAAGVGAGARGCVVPPITIAVLLGSREITVPEAVILPPGVKVSEAAGEVVGVVPGTGAD
jgi:hypothetical protein